jgi:hypothetical protein
MIDIRGPLKRARRLEQAARVAAFCAVVGSAQADLIYFQGGGAIQAPVAIRGDSIAIDLAGEEYDFAAEDVRARIPGFLPADAWRDRAARARTAGTAARFANAWWALENGLTDEAVAVI